MQITLHSERETEKMKLYYAPGTCALACWIALEWAGVEHSVEKVDPRSEAYRRINPLGLVPALDIGAGRAFTQADAILQYIARLNPAAQLGAEPEKVFEFDETMSFLTGDFHPAFWPYFVPDRFTTEAAPESLKAVREASYARIARVLKHLDVLVGDGQHVYGQRRSVADAYAFVMTRWSSDLPGEASWTHYKGVSRLMNTLSDDAAVQKVLSASSAQ